jgi:IQ calmodulin-binding motif
MTTRGGGFPPSSSSGGRSGGRSSSRTSQGTSGGFRDFNDQSSPTWNAKELNNNSMDFFEVDELNGGVATSNRLHHMPQLQQLQQPGGTTIKPRPHRREGPPTPDRNRAVRSQSPAVKRQQPRPDIGGGGPRSSPSWAMMMPAAAPSSSNRSGSRAKSRSKSVGDPDFDGGNPLRQTSAPWPAAAKSGDSDEAWNADSNWFASHSFENNNAASPAASAGPPVALGTVAHPIPVDSDLDSRERDLLKQASRKKKDHAETARDQDVLARNKASKTQRQLIATLSSKSQEDSSSGDNNNNKRGLFRLFGVSGSFLIPLPFHTSQIKDDLTTAPLETYSQGRGRKEASKRNKKKEPTVFGGDVEDRTESNDFVDAEAPTPRQRHTVSTDHIVQVPLPEEPPRPASLLREGRAHALSSAIGRLEDFANHHFHASAGPGRISDESTVSEVTDPTFFQKDAVPRTIVSPRRVKEQMYRSPQVTAPDPFDVHAFTADPFITDPSPRRLSTPVGSDDFSDPFFPPAASSSAGGGIDSDFVIETAPVPREEKKESEWEPLTDPTSAATRPGRFERAKARLSASPPRSRQASLTRSAQEAKPSERGDGNFKPTPLTAGARQDTPSKERESAFHRVAGASPKAGEAERRTGEESSVASVPTRQVVPVVPVSSARTITSRWNDHYKNLPHGSSESHVFSKKPPPPGPYNVAKFPAPKLTKSDIGASNSTPEAGPGLQVQNLTILPTDMRGRLIAGVPHGKVETGKGPSSPHFLSPEAPPTTGAVFSSGKTTQRANSTALVVSGNKASKGKPDTSTQLKTRPFPVPHTATPHAATEHPTSHVLYAQTTDARQVASLPYKLRRRHARRSFNSAERGKTFKMEKHAAPSETSQRQALPKSVSLTNRERIAILRTRSPPHDPSSNKLQVADVETTSYDLLSRKKLVGNQNRLKPTPEVVADRRKSSVPVFEPRAQSPRAHRDCSDDETCDTCSLASARSDIRRLRTYIRRSMKNKRLTVSDLGYELFVSEFSIYDEAKLKDPMHRAGLRLLSAAVVPIQTAVRRHLALRKALTRMWAIVVLQSLARRWIANTSYLRMRRASVTIQAWFRGCTVRDEALLKECCAIEIQRIVRGHLATIQVYEDIFRITIVQSIVRRKIAIDYATDKMILVLQLQGLARGFLWRQRLKEMNAAATVVQAKWRSFTCQFGYQLDLLDIIIVQSVWRKKRDIEVVEGMKWIRSNSSATRIQSQWRGFRARLKFFDVLAALTIQSKWRSHVCSTWYRQYRAARKVQASYRGYICSSWFNQYLAARKIQTCFRAYVYSTWYRQYKAATAIQTIFRMHVYSTWYRQYLSARTIQACFRCHVYSTWYRQYRAAVMIQACWRSYACSKRYLEYVAATMVQSHVRRYVCEKAYRGFRAARQIQAIVRCHQMSRKYRDYKARLNEYLSATKIQAQWRCYVCSRDYLHVIAAIIIQAAWRRFRCQQFYRQQRAAIQVQSIWRSYICSRNFLQIVAAIMIQAKWRAFVCAREYKRRRSAVLIQSHWRAFVCSKQYLLILAAIILQTQWRRFCCRQRFIKYRSAIRIQCHWRAYACTLRFLQNVADVLIVQCYVRRWIAQRKASHMKFTFARTIQMAVRSHQARQLLMELRDRKAAATKIQRVWRGFTVYVRYTFTVADIVVIQSLVRRWLSRTLCGKIRTVRNLHALLVLQRFARSTFHRKIDAAIKVQRVWRGFVSQTEYHIARYENAAALTIQTNWRRFSLRSTFVLMHWLSVRVQAVHRRNKVRTTFAQKKTSAVNIQRVFRGFVDRSLLRRYNIVKDAVTAGIPIEEAERLGATVIQAGVRCYFVRSAVMKFRGARKIQTAFRRYRDRDAFVQFLAVRKIQTFWRSCCVRWFFLEYTASRRIQSVWRGYVLRCAFKEYTNARRVQTTWRCYYLSKAYREYSSAKRIQTTWRRYILRLAYMEYMSARKVQTVWRRYVNFTAFREYKAARSVQASWRCTRARVAYKAYKAAQRIQSEWRSYRAQLAYREYKAARWIQSAWRCYHSRLAYREYLRARLIQSTWRGYSTRMAYLEFRAAARIQAAWRGYSARLCLCEFLAARKVQAVWRGWRTYHFYREYRSATKIQSIYRQKRARAAFVAMREQLMPETIAAAILAQKMWRGVSIRMKGLSFIIWHRRLFVEDPAATAIQKAWRGYVTIQAYWHTLGSTIQIQGAIRGWLVATKYRRYQASIRIQRCARRFLRLRKRRQYVENARAQSSTPRRRARSPYCQSDQSLQQDNADAGCRAPTPPLRATPRTNSPFQRILPRSVSPSFALPSSVLPSHPDGSNPRRPLAVKLATKIRSENKDVSATKIQSVCRRYLARSEVAEMLGAVILMQCTVRVYLAKSRAKQRGNSALRIQKFFLMVKQEVDREIEAAKKRRKAKKKCRKTLIIEEEEDRLLENIWQTTVDSMQDQYDAARKAHVARTGGKGATRRKVNASIDRRGSEANVSPPEGVQLRNPCRERNAKGRVGQSKSRGSEGLSTGELVLSMMTPDWVRNAAANYQFRIPSSRMTSVSRDELDQDKCLEEAWIDTEFSQAQAINNQSAHDNVPSRPRRMEV